jgi:hypothetical protein
MVGDTIRYVPTPVAFSPQILQFLVFSAKCSSVCRVFVLVVSRFGSWLGDFTASLGIFCREVDREVLVDMEQIQYSEKYFDDTYEYR